MAGGTMKKKTMRQYFAPLLAAFGLGALMVRPAKKKQAVDFQAGRYYFAHPADLRRAKQSEVTPEMMREAIAALAQPLGTRIDCEGGYTIILETHHNASKGYHKGATVFLPLA